MKELHYVCAHSIFGHGEGTYGISFCKRISVWSAISSSFRTQLRGKCNRHLICHERVLTPESNFLTMLTESYLYLWPKKASTETYNKLGHARNLTLHLNSMRRVRNRRSKNLYRPETSQIPIHAWTFQVPVIGRIKQPPTSLSLFSCRGAREVARIIVRGRQLEAGLWSMQIGLRKILSCQLYSDGYVPAVRPWTLKS